MMRFFIILIVSLLLNGSANAFDTKGHDAIEKKAYELLKQRPSDVLPDGNTILQYLINSFILCQDAPLPHSSYPDLSLERQFMQDRQMYHFMTSNRDVMQAAKMDEPTAQMRALLASSLQPCLRMFWFFMSETLENPQGASQSGRGIYVLMHIIADSYSPEHVTRDATNMELQTIKGWRLNRLWWPSAAKEINHDGTLRLLHNSFHSIGDHTAVQKGTLSPGAMKAAQAIKDLLILVYKCKNSIGNQDQLIRTFIEQNFRPYNSSITGTAFTFRNYSDTIIYDFHEEYNEDRINTTFGYDRFPQYYFMIQGNFNFSHKPCLRSFGVELGSWVTPTAADDSKSFIHRIPYGYGFSLSEIPMVNNKYSFLPSLKLSGFLLTSIALPLVNASLDINAGVALLPLATATHFSFSGGGDLAWTIGSDWGFPFTRTTCTTRFSLGYQYCSTIIPVHNAITVKVGINTWHGRVIFR